MSDRIPPAIRRLVQERADGQCEGCGTHTRQLELHHRKYRSRGGKHTPQNLLALCGWGNHTGCHGRAHNPDHPEGWSLHSWDDPTVSPVLHARYGRCLLGDDGTVHTGEVVF